MKKAARIALLAVVVVTGVAVAGIFYVKSLEGTGSLPGAKVTQAILWRAQLFARKARGGIPDLSWVELWRMSRRPGGFGLGQMVLRGVSADGSIENAYDSEEDHRAGSRIFRERCAACHGDNGTGGQSPPLNRSRLKHGASDLAIYKVLRDGIPGTAMIAADLSLSERWQVVGYVKTLLIYGSGHGADGAAPLDVYVSDERIRSAGNRTDEWLTYSGALDGRRYTPLHEITPANVSRLRVRWVRQFERSEPIIEATPLVVGGVLFTTVPPSDVVALHARSGEVIWRYDRNVPADVPVCCGRVNRGVAILGKTLFLGSLDGYLVAINADTGKELWQTRIANPSEGYSMTGAPLIANRSVVVGVAGGEYGIRGFLAAYDPATGREQWRFNTIPGPGEPGHETWQGDAWRSGGGPTWITGSYDPELDLLYWGVGNPGPDFSGDVRPGDNLYTNSVIALQGSTGKLVWHFQFTPHDERDWDSTQTPVLTEIPIRGVRRKVICWVNRNGFYYVLDRTTGEFLVGVPFVEQNWAKGLDAKGRPIPADASQVSNSGRVIRPGVGGGTNWQNPAFDRESGSIFVHATEGASVFTKSAEVRRGAQGFFLGSAGSWAQPPTPVVRALDAATGARKWERILPLPDDFTFTYSGLLATGGGLVFGASGGSAFALDSATGQELWRVSLGGDTRAAPISFTVEGRQVIALSAGRALFVFGL